MTQKGSLGRHIQKPNSYKSGHPDGGPRYPEMEAVLKFGYDPNHPRLEFINPEKYFRLLEAERFSGLVRLTGGCQV
ncbi:MAG: hypothetical protein ACUVR0_11335 [Candidatus Aminicenantales bacterium]